MSKVVPIREPAPLSIGGLSRSTGVPVETLRTWERRYGFPSPVRTPSGHRRYTLDTVEKLELVKAALDNGHRASEVLRCSTAQLEDLLSLDARAEPDPDAEVPAERDPASSSPRIERWIDQVMAFQGEALDRELELAWQQAGAKSFVLDQATVFMREIGELWSAGELGVAHEHFASERLRDFLSGRWRSLANHAGGARVLCAALSGELHTLPLHFAAVLLALEGLEPNVLGADTPEPDIGQACDLFGARAILVGTSRAADPDRTYDQLRNLRGLVARDVPIVVGGGRGEVPQGVMRLRHLADLSTWAYTLDALTQAD